MLKSSNSLWVWGFFITFASRNDNQLKSSTIMELKNDITREQLIILMAKHIKECSKNLSDANPIDRVSIYHSNWVNGLKRWSFTRITIAGKQYNFYDKEITDREFLVMVNTALKESGCKGHIDIDEAWDVKRFKALYVIGKPCKEFVMLNRLLKKYANKEIKEMEVYYARVCGKRSSWSANMSEAEYLDFSGKRCQKMVDFIRKTRATNDIISVSTKEELSHGDDMDYKVAQYQESEWYGSLCNNLELDITTPKGKHKGTCTAFNI